MISKKTLETVPIGTIINAVLVIDAMRLNRGYYIPDFIGGDEDETWYTYHTGLSEEANKIIYGALSKGIKPLVIIDIILGQYAEEGVEPVVNCTGHGFLYSLPISGMGQDNTTEELQEYLTSYCGDEDAAVLAMQDIIDGVAPDAQRCDELKALLLALEERMHYCSVVHWTIRQGLSRLDDIPGAITYKMGRREYKHACNLSGANYEDNLYYLLLRVHNVISKYLDDAGVEGMRFLDWADEGGSE